MSEASIPVIVSLITVLIFSTALETPLPRYLLLSPSRSSRASNSPVDAPLGAVPLETVPSIRVTSASTVGFPRESRISLPTTFQFPNKPFLQSPYLLIRRLPSGRSAVPSGE